MIEEPFWSPPKKVSGAVVAAFVVAAALTSGGELALWLLLAAAAPIACLWAPYAIAKFPLAGAWFVGRPLSHESSEESVIIIGWIFLVLWAVYAALRIFWWISE